MKIHRKILESLLSINITFAQTITDIRQGEVVYPFKPQDGKEDTKLSKQEDLATSGSLNESSKIPAK